MEITFGIITIGNDNFISQMIQSIEKQNIPVYEILIVGKCGISSKNTTIIPFDEKVKQAWITRKKNLITKYAKYDTIVYMHDYVVLNDGWYKGMEQCAEFDILITPILNANGRRFRDWALCPLFIEGKYGKHPVNYDWNKGCLLPYDFSSKTLNSYIYISGAYFIAKKYVMQEFPLNEKLSWGQGEDVEWCSLVSPKYTFSCNPNSSVRFLKNKHSCLWEKLISDEDLKNIC